MRAYNNPMDDEPAHLILEQIKLLHGKVDSLKNEQSLFKRDVMSRMEVLSNRVLNNERLFGDYMSEIALIRYDLTDLRKVADQILKHKSDP